MAKYSNVLRNNAGQTIGRTVPRSYKGEAATDARLAFQDPHVQTVELRRWDKPRRDNAGQVDSWDSETGKPYDQVILEIIQRSGE